MKTVRKRKIKNIRLIVILAIIIILIIIGLLITKNKDEEAIAKLDSNDLKRYAGKYSLIYSDSNGFIDGLTFKEDIELKICEKKKEKDCLSLDGDDKFLLLGDKENNYIFIPVEYLVNKKESDIKQHMDEYKSVICFKRTDYMLDQIMCPPEDNRFYEKEDLSTEYSFKLYKK